MLYSLVSLNGRFLSSLWVDVQIGTEAPVNGPARGMGKRGSNRIHAWQPFMGETRGERKHVFSVRVLSRVLLRYLVRIIILRVYSEKVTLWIDYHLEIILTENKIMNNKQFKFSYIPSVKISIVLSNLIWRNAFRGHANGPRYCVKRQGDFKITVQE